MKVMLRRSPRFTMPITKHRRKCKRLRAERMPRRKDTRGVVRIPRVVGQGFQGIGRSGDFLFELRSDYRTLFVYNENAHTQTDKCNNIAGGGNAIVRPYRPSGRVIGIPTGFNMGFRHLQEHHTVFGVAREMIDTAIDEIVDHVVAHPNRFDKIKFSANADGKIGTGIFVVGDDVRNYITERLLLLPRLIDRRLHMIRADALTSPDVAPTGASHAPSSVPPSSSFMPLSAAPFFPRRSEATLMNALDLQT